ncbi:unnamed protein product [Parajaminaea phylloscopi]
MLARIVLYLAVLASLALAAPMPMPIPRPTSSGSLGPRGVTGRGAAAAGPQPTEAPLMLPRDPTPDDLYHFYGPLDQAIPARPVRPPTSVLQRDEQPPVPTSQLPYPTFPAQYASCPKCQADYWKISSCAQASSAFQNDTTIFSDPTKYYSIIKCACTDTFQAVYPQCLDCFQHTDQCWYLGTDPKGTGAPAIVSNMRSICALGSALLGKVASTNQGGWNYTYTPSDPGYYTDVTTMGPGYVDQSTGPIFGSGASVSAPLGHATMRTVLLGVALAAVILAAL